MLSPKPAAICNGVYSPASTAFTNAPPSSSASAASACPALAARCKAVWPLSPFSRTLAPAAASSVIDAAAPDRAAAQRAVSPATPGRSTSAPASSSSCSTPVWPLCAAAPRLDLLALVSASAFAPALSNSATTAALPCKLATKSAVTPSVGCRSSRSAPVAASDATAPVSPSRAAWINSSTPPCTGVGASNPAASRTGSTRSTPHRAAGGRARCRAPLARSMAQRHRCFPPSRRLRRLRGCRR